MTVRRPTPTRSSFRRKSESLPFVIPAEAGIHLEGSALTSTARGLTATRLARPVYAPPRSTCYLHRATGNGCPPHLVRATVACSLRSSRSRAACDHLDGKRAISDGRFPNDERVRCVTHPVLPGAEEAHCGGENRCRCPQSRSIPINGSALLWISCCLGRIPFRCAQ